MYRVVSKVNFLLDLGHGRGVLHGKGDPYGHDHKVVDGVDSVIVGYQEAGWLDVFPEETKQEAPRAVPAPPPVKAPEPPPVQEPPAPPQEEAPAPFEGASPAPEVDPLDALMDEMSPAGESSESAGAPGAPEGHGGKRGKGRRGQ